MLRKIQSLVAAAPEVIAALVLGLAIGGLAACGDDAASCAKTVCDPVTFGSVCLGHAVQSCAADGKGFVYTACGAQQRCDGGGAPSSPTASCVARSCTTLAQSTCRTVTETERCKDDGSGFETIPCGSGEVCKDGTCVISPCTNERDVCTTNGFLTCTDAAWVQSNCPVGQLCTVADNGVARCNAAACTAEARRCDGTRVGVCDARGAVETLVACAKGEVCLDGFCQDPVCGGSEPVDTSGGDAETQEEVTEPESRIVFTLNGASNTFDISAFATFDTGNRQVTVKASKSTRSLELRFSPANQTVQGVFSSEIFNPVKVLVCYDTGGSPGSFDDCVGFTHRSVAYDVSVTRNDGPGGRFEASFSVTLADENTETIQLTGGQINVKYR